MALYREHKNVFETSLKAGTAEVGSRLGTVPIVFDINLNGIAPGRYDCQVSVLDPSDEKVAFWVAPILIVP